MNQPARGISKSSRLRPSMHIPAEGRMSETMPFYIWSHRLTITFPPPSSFAFRHESGRLIRHVDIFLNCRSSFIFPCRIAKVQTPRCRIDGHFHPSSLLNKVNAVVGVNLLSLIWIGIAADGLDRSAAVIFLGIIRASMRAAVSRRVYRLYVSTFMH